MQDMLTKDHDTYISGVQSLLDDFPDVHWSIEAKGSESTKIFYTDMSTDYPISDPAALVARSAELKEQRATSICIIENISGEYVEALGSKWKIDPTFFVAHATNPDRSQLWGSKGWNWSSPTVPSTKPGHMRQLSTEIERYVETGDRRPTFLENAFGHLDGIFEYHNEKPDLEPRAYGLLDSAPNFIRRHCFKDAGGYKRDRKWPIQSNTRISYCRPNTYMCKQLPQNEELHFNRMFALDLFLVDAPLHLSDEILDRDSRSFPTLRFQNSTSRGGVELPRLFSDSTNKHSLFEILKRFCEHPWHNRILFDLHETSKGYRMDGSTNVLPAHPLIYLLSCCLWEENLRYLDKEIKYISFREIRNPKLEINTVLHDRREDLARLKASLVDTAMYVPESVAEYFNSRFKLDVISRNPVENLNRLSGEATKLEAFLMETFQLFMSSISVQGSRLSIKQARLSIDQAQRGSRLTLLAFIYVPLSFVTGVFGMNIQQINGSGLNIWVCFVALAVVVFATVPVFLGVKLYGDRKDTKEKLAYDPEA